MTKIRTQPPKENAKTPRVFDVKENMFHVSVFVALVFAFVLEDP